MADIVEELVQRIPETELLKSVELNNPLSTETQPLADLVAEQNQQLREKISKSAQNSFLPTDAEFLKVKNYLKSNVGAKNPVSLYDHLTDVVMKAMETRNGNLVDDFERLSLAVKKSHFVVNPNAPTSLKQVHENHIQNETAVARLKLLQHNAENSDGEIGEIPDMMELAALWEWAGVSFGKEDSFLLFLSIKRLVQAKQLRSVRLWGKIIGRDANYIVAEGEIKEGAEDLDDSAANSIASTPESGNEKLSEVDSSTKGPKATKAKQFLPLAKELRQGANKYIYYVCHSAGEEWTRLPDVIPERLQEARKIQKYFTGNLSTKIESYPEFRGNEAQYLRCQIARISASTVVSPKGYYIIDEEAEQPEEGAGVQAIIVNPEFEGIPNDQLANISNWVHHIPFVLPQGKSVYEAPKPVKESRDGEEEEEEEGEEEKEEVHEPEVGPETLSPVSADQEHGNIPAWSARVCSKLSPTKFSPITLRSNRWPGAFALAYNDKFANVYIGDGQKDIGNPSQNFLPPPLPVVQKEYAVEENNPEKAGLLIEQTDPTVEDEKKYEDSKKPPVEEKLDDEAGDAEDDAEEEKEEE